MHAGSRAIFVSIKERAEREGVPVAYGDRVGQPSKVKGERCNKDEQGQNKADNRRRPCTHIVRIVDFEVFDVSCKRRRG